MTQRCDAWNVNATPTSTVADQLMAAPCSPCREHLPPNQAAKGGEQLSPRSPGTDEYKRSSDDSSLLSYAKIDRQEGSMKKWSIQHCFAHSNATTLNFLPRTKLLEYRSREPEADFILP